MESTEFIFDLPANLLDTKLPDPYMVKYFRDLENRILWIDEEITSELIHEITHYILKWNKEDKDIPEIDRKPIKLLFNSPGVDLGGRRMIKKKIELSKTPIVGIAIGLVGSAASLIYLYCHVRLALKSSYFILHKGSATLSGDFENIMSSIDDYKKEVEKMVSVIIERSNFTQEEVEEHIKKDWYVRANEAFEKGLVDEIISDINVFL